MQVDSNIIFIDFFDTVVFRKISPDKTKEQWAQHISRAIDYVVLPQLLLQFRLSSEKTLELHNANGQFDYFELMEVIYNKILYHFQGFTMEKQAFQQVAKDIEEKIELETQYLNKELVKQLYVEKSKGKDIYLISDFYLGRDSYNKFIKRLGIADLFKEIYVSCDYGLSKSVGLLYNLVLDREHIMASDVVMIGDTKYSDCLIPQQIGIKTHYIPNSKQKRLYNKQRHSSIKDAVKHIANSGNGWSNYAFSLYMFCDRLYVECVRSGIKRLFFLAREGAFLKKLFDMYMQNKDIIIDTQYLYVSRNSAFLASMGSLNNEKFEVLFRQYNKFSVRSFLKALCFSDDEISKLSFDDKDKIIKDFSLSEEFKALKKDKVFSEIYDKKRCEQKRNFLKHLFNLGYKENEDIYLVDVGWKGSMQDNLFRIFDNAIRVKGYYLGLIGKGNISEANDKVGLLFDLATNRAVTHSDIYLYEYLLYELILAAEHGKTVGYDDAGNPQLINDEDGLAYKEYVGEIQRSITLKFLNIVKLYNKNIMTFNDIKIFESIHAKLFKKMNLKALCIWRKLEILHQDSFLGLGTRMGGRLLFSIKKKIKPYVRIKRFLSSKNFVRIEY